MKKEHLTNILIAILATIAFICSLILGYILGGL